MFAKFRKLLDTNAWVAEREAARSFDSNKHAFMRLTETAYTHLINKDYFTDNPTLHALKGMVITSDDYKSKLTAELARLKKSHDAKFGLITSFLNTMTTFEVNAITALEVSFKAEDGVTEILIEKLHSATNPDNSYSAASAALGGRVSEDNTAAATPASTVSYEPLFAQPAPQSKAANTTDINLTEGRFAQLK